MIRTLIASGALAVFALLGPAKASAQVPVWAGGFVGGGFQAGGGYVPGFALGAEFRFAPGGGYVGEFGNATQFRAGGGYNPVPVAPRAVRTYPLYPGRRVVLFRRVPILPVRVEFGK